MFRLYSSDATLTCLISVSVDLTSSTGDEISFRSNLGDKQPRARASKPITARRRWWQPHGVLCAGRPLWLLVLLLMLLLLLLVISGLRRR